MSNKQLINNILSLPNAPIILNEVNTKLVEEQKKRIQFYNDISDQEKAEFINGEIIIHSPVKKEHNDVASALYRLISIYVSKNKLGYLGYDKIMISLSRNDYEPDICFFKKEKSKKFKKGQSLFPAPDFVVEVLSKGTAKIDKGIKFKDYQAHQIFEYWMINPSTEVVEQFRLNKKGEYELILKTKTGIIECKSIKGFKIPVKAIFNEDQNMKEIERIIVEK